MPIVADTYRFVVGVDTHSQTHQYAIIIAATGQAVDEAEFAADPAGLRRAIAWIGRRTEGDLDAVLVSVEGTGSYGAQLTRLLLEDHYRVVDAPTPKRGRGQSKNDSIDAFKAARNVLACQVDHLADARNGETVRMLQVLLASRDRLTTESTRAINALVALLRVHDLGFDARRKPTLTQVRHIARWHLPPTSSLTALTVAKTEAVALARRIVELHDQIHTNEQQLQQIVTNTEANLLTQVGIGPVTAAVIITARSHEGRLRSEAAFAALGGVSPIQIASGNRDEHRLNRGGDRQLNRALHTIAVTRMRIDPTTRAYVERRRAQGLSDRRIRRCLKRYISRQVYRSLESTPAPS